MSEPHEPAPGLPEPVAVTGSQLSALFTHVDAVVVSFAADGTVLWVSPSVRSELGYEVSALVGQNVVDFMHPDDLGPLAERWASWIGRSGAGQEPDYRVRHADGSWARVTVEAFAGDEIAPFGAGVATMRRLEKATRTEQELRERLMNEDRLVRLATTFVRLPIEEFDEGVEATLAQLGRLKSVDRVSVFRASGDEVVLTHQWLAPGVAPLEQPLAPMRIEDSPFLTQLSEMREVYIADGSAVDDSVTGAHEMHEAGIQTLLAMPMVEQGHFAGFVSFSSVQAVPLQEASYVSMLRAAAGFLGEAFARHEAEERLAFEARADSVTGLGNRWAFMDSLAEALDRVGDGSSPGLAVLLCDLDRFKVVNDSLGHAAGDLLLAEVAARLGAATEVGERLFRFGGDEIVALLDEVDDPDAAVARSRQLLTELEAPFTIEGHEVFVAASGGIVVAHDADLDAAELLRRADAAMFQAKDHGRDRIAVFDDSMRDEINERLRRESELRRAVRDDQLELHYQPEVDLRTDDILGVEALVRWRHPVRGLLPAGEFIELAEETGAILEIGEWVFGEACGQLARWQAEGLGLVMRVNLSARQINQPDLVPRLIDEIGRSGIDPTSLCLEITETAVMADAELSLEVLEKLRSLGLQLAIDDFGTGYSSLSYLKRFPVDVLKIDQSFVAGLGHDRDDTAIVRAILSMADALGLTVTAEGVETAEQLTALRAVGCERAQGFLLSRPIPIDELEALLTQTRPTPSP